MFNSWKLIGFQESDEFFNHLKTQKITIRKAILGIYFGVPGSSK